MSDFELFQGLDQNNGGESSAEAFEAFKERMRKNAKHIKALQKGEAKQKKKEDKLAKIISDFLRKHKKGDLLILVARLLEENIPAAFILSIILLGNEDIQEEAGIKLALPEKITDELQAKNMEEKAQAITIFGKESVLPLKIKISIDLWGKSIYEAGINLPFKILETVMTIDQKIKPIVIQTGAKILEDYLKQNEIDFAIIAVNDFCQLMFEGLIKKISQETEGRKTIKEAEE